MLSSKYPKIVHESNGVCYRMRYIDICVTKEEEKMYQQL